MIRKRGDYYHMDVMINGVRYREALDTTDAREAKNLEKKRVAEIHQGKGASKAGRDFARLPFSEAATRFLEESAPHVAKRTAQFYRERLKPLGRFFKDKPLMRLNASDIGAYQRERLGQVAGRTVNMEISVLRQMMKRAKVWSVVAEDVKMLREGDQQIARVLTKEQKAHLFRVAGTSERWMVAQCAAVLAASTTCRGVELKNLRWSDVDLFEREMRINRSKTAAGRRTIPLNSDALGSLSRLRDRADLEGSAGPEDYVFPACEWGRIDPKKPMASWRTAWRSLTREAARQEGRDAARDALSRGAGLKAARLAYRKASEPFSGLRFHDLRHQAITELAEAGCADHTLMSMAGHMSRRMLDHYSHVRMAAKREAVTAIESGLMASNYSGWERAARPQ